MKNATAKEWKELYELTKLIQKKKPWEKYHDGDLIGIMIDGELYFVSIMGNAGQCKGIVVYEGIDGYNYMFAISHSDQFPGSTQYIMGEQNCLTCYFGEKKELDDEDLMLMKKIQYRSTKDNWIYFRSFESRYYPSPLEQREVRLLIAIYDTMLYLLWDRANYNRIEWEEEFPLVVKEGEKITITTSPWLPQGPPFEMVSLDEEEIKKFKSNRKSDIDLAIDLFYTFDYIEDDGFDKLINPLVFSAFDLTNEMPIYIDLIPVNESQNDFILSTLQTFIEEEGYPNRIVVRNEKVFLTLVNLCDELGIEIVIDQLNIVDEVIANIMDDVFDEENQLLVDKN